MVLCSTLMQQCFTSTAAGKIRPATQWVYPQRKSAGAWAKSETLFMIPSLSMTAPINSISQPARSCYYQIPPNNLRTFHALQVCASGPNACYTTALKQTACANYGLSAPDGPLRVDFVGARRPTYRRVIKAVKATTYRQSSSRFREDAGEQQWKTRSRCTTALDAVLI